MEQKRKEVSSKMDELEKVKSQRKAKEMGLLYLQESVKKQER